MFLAYLVAYLYYCTQKIDMQIKSVVYFSFFLDPSVLDAKYEISKMLNKKIVLLIKNRPLRTIIIQSTVPFFKIIICSNSAHVTYNFTGYQLYLTFHRCKFRTGFMKSIAVKWQAISDYPGHAFYRHTVKLQGDSIMRLNYFNFFTVLH